MLNKGYAAYQAGKQSIADLESQEPLAYLCEPDEDGLFGLPTPDRGCKDCFPVYRHLHRTWVGLTDDDVSGFVEQYWDDDNMTMRSMVRVIEAKLKEKNT
jgi:hypothetical protein